LFFSLVYSQGIIANWTVCASANDACYISFAPDGLIISSRDNWVPNFPSWNITRYKCVGGYNQENCQAEWSTGVVAENKGYRIDDEYPFTSNGYTLLGYKANLTSQAVLITVCIGDTTGDQSFNCTYVATDIFYFLTYEVSPTAEYTAIRHMLPNGTPQGPVEFYVLEANTGKQLYFYRTSTPGVGWDPGPWSGVVWLSDHVVMFYTGGGDPSFSNTTTIVYDLQAQMGYESQNSWYTITQNDFMSGGNVCQNMFPAYTDTNVLVIWNVTSHSFKEISLVPTTLSTPAASYYFSEDCTYLYFSTLYNQTSTYIYQFSLSSLSITGKEIITTTGPNNQYYFLYGRGNVLYLAQPMNLRRIEFLSPGIVDNKIIMPLQNQIWGPGKIDTFFWPFWGSSYVQQGKLVLPYFDIPDQNDNGAWYFAVIDLEL